MNQLPVFIFLRYDPSLWNQSKSIVKFCELRSANQLDVVVYSGCIR